MSDIAIFQQQLFRDTTNSSRFIDGCIRHEGKTLHPPFRAISVEMICRPGPACEWGALGERGAR
jgi:hypothetical protein